MLAFGGELLASAYTVVSASHQTLWSATTGECQCSPENETKWNCFARFPSFPGRIRYEIAAHCALRRRSVVFRARHQRVAAE